DDIQTEWLNNKQSIGITAGASAPEILVQEVTQRLAALGAKVLPDDQGIVENVSFVLPKALRQVDIKTETNAAPANK
ncbi:MAG TPA: hypothetical protein ENK78_01410, partial [Thiothrix sp.]|nr:hypothetical protein [Thiothrix sp.]